MPITIKHITDIAPHEGPHTIPGIRFRPARQALGVSAWGMNVIEFEPACSGYPAHDHRHDGQEEVYVVLTGDLTLVAEGVEHSLRQGDLVRVPPELTRQFISRQSGARLLALGATPGQAFTTDPRMGGA